MPANFGINKPFRNSSFQQNYKRSIETRVPKRVRLKPSSVVRSYEREGMPPQAAQASWP
jgi:hypothetical protein